jgi:hypothetical protein
LAPGQWLARRVSAGRRAIPPPRSRSLRVFLASCRVSAHLQRRSHQDLPGQNTLGGGGIRTRVLRSFNRPSPSAASMKLSGAASLLAVEPPRIQLSVPSGSLTSLPGKPYLMASTFRSVGLRPGERRYLSSERELRLGVCFWFRLFNVVPETTARFSYIDDRSRNQSPPWCEFSSWPVGQPHHCMGFVRSSLPG